MLNGSVAAAQTANLVASPVPLDKTGKPTAGWTLTGNASALPEPSYIREGMADVPTAQAQGAKMAYTIQAPPATELIVTADVQSDGKVIGYIGESRMSYHRQGKRQTLAGFARVDEKGKLELSFLVSGFEKNKPASFDIRNVTARKLDRPQRLQRLPATGETAIVADGTAQASIIYPSSVPALKDAAGKLSERIAQLSGTELPVLSDTEATAADAPKLRDDLRGRHLILIGRLGTNRAMWTAYNQWLDSTDGYYPGGDGYNLRTAVNVLRNGKNHLVVGGSSDAGAARAVEKLLAALDKAKASKGSLSLPFLLDVELQGDCLKAFKDHDQAWSDPSNRALPPVEPGYGTVRRWYENAMGWYWSGWDSYRQRAGVTGAAVLKDRAYTHHYIAEFLVRTYDMIDETGLMSPEQREQMETLILANFLDFATKAGDGSWMTTFTPPYDNVQIMNRHQISPWMADYVLARFLGQTFTLPDDLKALAGFRESEKSAFFHHVLDERWESSLPGGSDETQEEYCHAFSRFALENERYDYFNSGRAAKMLNLDKLSQLTGAWVRPGGGNFDNGLLLNTLASYYRDGRYVALTKLIPPAESFMNRTLNGMHRYVPGAEVPEKDPSDLAGVLMPETMPHRQRQLASLKAGKFAPIKFKPEQAFDYIAFRSGFEKHDDFVAVNGLVGQGIPGTFLAFASQGVEWLPGGMHTRGGGSDSYFEHNAVHVVRTDRWGQDPAPFAAAARLDWQGAVGSGQQAATSGQGPGQTSGAVCFTLDPHAGARWQRAVVWIRPGLFLVRDIVRASQAGDYQVTIHWRPAGQGSWDSDAWVASAGGARLRLTPLSQDFAIHQNASSASDAGERPRLRLFASRTLKTDEPLTAYAVLETYKPAGSGQPAAGGGLRAHAIDNGVALLDPATGNVQQLVLFGPDPAAGIETDAACLIVSADSIRVIHGRTLTISGRSLLKKDRKDQPVSVKLSDGDAGGIAKRLLGQSARQPALAAKPQAADHAKVADEANAWKQAWKIDDLRQPTAVSAVKHLGGGVFDFGREIEIAEIYPKPQGGPWVVRRIPADLRYAAGEKAPPADSPLWKAFDKPEMMPGVVTGNYGRAEPTAESHEVLRPKGVKARFLKSASFNNLIVRDAETLGREIPLTLKQADLDGDGKDELIVHTLDFPKFIRGVHGVTDTLAVYSPDGKQRFRHDYPIRVQSIGLVQLNGADQTLLVAGQDCKISLLKPDGSTARQFDLFAMHQQFHETYGRKNTRHPAGGLTMPFAVGPWRSTGSEPGFAVARYHCFSFIGADGKLEGVLSDGSYVQPAMLSRGIDFDGDGAEEQVCLGRGVVFQLHGPLDQRVEEPTGTKFYPQVYHAKRLPEPAWEDRLDGSRPLAFQPIRAGATKDGRPQYVLAIRDNYAGIYDAANHKWAFSWIPTVPMRSACVVEDAPGRLKLAAVTADDLLWQLEFAGRDLTKLADFQVRPLPVPAASLAAGADGKLLLAGSEGVYLAGTDEAPAKIASGSFVEAASVEGSGVVAVGRDGSVVRLDRSAGGAGTAGSATGAGGNAKP